MTTARVVIELHAEGDRVFARAECGACGERALCDVRAERIHGYSGGEPARDAQVRAVLTRAALSALRRGGCRHAMHDRAAMADCALRPDRAKLAAVMAALFDVDEEAMREVMRASGLVARWTDDRVVLQWHAGSAPAMEETAVCEVNGRVAHAATSMSAEEAWELFSARGFVPVEWLGAESRSFRAHIEQGIARAVNTNVRRWRATAAPTKAPSKGADPSSPSPLSLRACVTMAADCDGAIAAEVLVREVLERLQPWGVRKQQRICWRIVDASRWRTERQSYWSDSLRDTIASVLEGLPYQLPAGYRPTDPPPKPAWWSLAAAESELARLWDELASNGVARGMGKNGAVVRDFRTLPNPYEPLLAIWSTGFVFDELTADEAVLVAAQW